MNESGQGDFMGLLVLTFIKKQFYLLFYSGNFHEEFANSEISITFSMGLDDRIDITIQWLCVKTR